MEWFRNGYDRDLRMMFRATGMMMRETRDRQIGRSEDTIPEEAGGAWKPRRHVLKADIASL
jgi:hypothetical protein